MRGTWYSVLYCTVGTNPAKTCCIISIRGPGPVNHPRHHVSLNLWSVSCEITLNCYYVRHCVGDLMTLTVSTSEDNCLSLTTETTDWQLVTCFTTSAQDHIPQLQFSADGGPVPWRGDQFLRWPLRLSLTWCKQGKFRARQREHLRILHLYFCVHI